MSDMFFSDRVRYVLANAFKTEKMYRAMSNTDRREAIRDVAFAELAGEIRAAEWIEGFVSLRRFISDELLGKIRTNAPVSVVLEVLLAKLRNYEDLVAQLRDELAIVHARLADCLSAGDYSRMMKLSLEANKLKSRQQVNCVIRDELIALARLVGYKPDSGHSSQEVKSNMVGLAQNRPVAVSSSEAESDIALVAGVKDGEREQVSKVLEFRRKIA